MVHQGGVDLVGHAVPVRIGARGCRGLAGAATIQRLMGNSDPEALLCCSQYGQPFRNSDPHIGQVTNQVVSAGLTATLADPPGL